MGDLSRVANFVVLDLVDIDSLCKLVRLAESYDWNLVLAGDVGDH